MGKRKFTIFLMPIEDGIYRAFSPFYPGCITDGDTVDEALKHAKEAMEGILQAEAKNNGDTVPPYVYADHVVIGEVDIEVPDSLIGAEEEGATRASG